MRSLFIHAIVAAVLVGSFAGAAEAGGRKGTKVAGFVQRANVSGNGLGQPPMFSLDTIGATREHGYVRAVSPSKVHQFFYMRELNSM